MVKPMYLYLVLTCFNTDIVSGFPMLLHAWNDLKYIFLYLVCRKGFPLTKKNMWLVTQCGGVCLCEGGRVSLGWYCADMYSF